MTKTIAEIVNETLAYYEEDPGRRATNSTGDCMYIDCTGRMCAVGRCMLPEVLPRLEGAVLGAFELHNRLGFDGALDENDECTSIDEVLKPEYRGHPAAFWDSLQSLHDQTRFWIGDTTHERHERAAFIIARYQPTTN